MFIGEFHHNIDEKKRLIIPAKYRDKLGNDFIVTKGLEKCLYVYSLDEWNKLTSKINTLPFTKKDARTFTRTFFAGANDCSFDKSGRIVLTDTQATYASLEKACVIIGVGERLEIWAKDSYENFMNDNADAMEDIAEHLFEVEDAL